MLILCMTYLPWVPCLLARLDPDVLYRLGSNTLPRRLGKEAFLVKSGTGTDITSLLGSGFGVGGLLATLQ